MTLKKILPLVALLVVCILCGCQGLGVSASNNGNNGNPTPTATPTPTPTPTLQGSVNHIIFMAQENRSFDAYFGKLNDFRASQSPALGANVDDLENTFSQQTDSPGINVSSFHLTTSCIYNTTAAWQESHGEVNRDQPADGNPVLMNGFAHTMGGLAKFDGDPDTAGLRAMGFYNGGDLPSPYFFATHYATSDRWYAPAPIQTEAVRLYSMAATSQGHAHPPQDTHSTLTAKTIFQLLDAANISWKIYSVDVDPNTGRMITFLNFFQPYGNSKQDHVFPISQYFTDVAAGTLPQFAYIEPGFQSGRDEHPGKTNNIQTGAAFMNSILSAFINSPSYKDSIFVETFDEGGGLFDHVSPMIDGQPIQELTVSGGNQTVVNGPYSGDVATQHVPNPDGIPPQDLDPTKDPSGNFTRTGFRVPLIIVSPFAKPGYVSHTPMDYTAVLKFVEKRWSLPTLTLRDAAQADMEEFFDWTGPNATAPAIPSQPTSMACNANSASQTLP